MRTKKFAKETNQIWVKKKNVSNKNVPLLALNKPCEDNPELIGYFVKGAPAILTSNQHEGIDLSIVHGTKCILGNFF